MARRLRGARWRRLAFTVFAIALAGGSAAVFTLANREMIQAELAPVLLPAAPPPAPEAPALASSQSRPVTLPGTEADPNKVQARVIVPADPAPPPVAAAPAGPPPIQMQAPPATAPRTISLSAAPPATVPAATEEAPLPSAAIGFAPLPAPRPARAP
ncbi:hypothetical protein [Phreatobacter cathodiphilus]|nr:hypothetical protein [Phreatobacter cathodiphilus]